MRFLTLDQLPKKPEGEAEKANDQYWKHIESDALKDTNILLILNEIRNCDPETMTKSMLVSKLSKIKTFQELIDFAPFVERKQQEAKEEEEQDEDT